MSSVKQSTVGIKSSLGVKMSPTHIFRALLLIYRSLSQQETGYSRRTECRVATNLFLHAQCNNLIMLCKYPPKRI